jgi:hypothetical protein
MSLNLLASFLLAITDHTVLVVHYFSCSILPIIGDLMMEVGTTFQQIFDDLLCRLTSFVAPICNTQFL